MNFTFSMFLLVYNYKKKRFLIHNSKTISNTRESHNHMFDNQIKQLISTFSESKPDSGE